MRLLAVFDPLCRNYFQYYDLEGNPRRIPKFRDHMRCSLAGSTQKLLFILTYLKENPRQHYQGQLFGMQQPRVSKWIKVLLPLLEKALKQLKVLPKRFGYALYAFRQTFTRIVKEKIRLRFQDVRDQVMLIACGLHNLRTAARIA